MSLESRNSSLPSFQEKLIFRLCSLGKAGLRSHFCLELHLHCSSVYSPFRVQTPLLLLASLPAVISLSASSALSQPRFIHPLNIVKLQLTDTVLRKPLSQSLPIYLSQDILLLSFFWSLYDRNSKDLAKWLCLTTELSENTPRRQAQLSFQETQPAFGNGRAGGAVGIVV